MSGHKAFLVVVFIAFYSIAYSQTLTNSPYSRYGIGEIIENSIAQSQAMGGIDQGVRFSSWINYNNPASYSALELTTFQTGAKISQTELITANSAQKVRNGNMTALVFGIPITRYLSMSFGLLPFSGLGYKISSVGRTENGNAVNYLYNGSGGLNRVYLGAGITPFKYKPDSSWLKGISLGANVSYLFGSLNYERREIFLNASSNFYYNLRDISVYELSGVYLDYGIQYKSKINKKWFLVSGITFSTPSKLSGTFSNLAQTYYVANGFEYPRDTVSNLGPQSGYITLPSKLGFGAVAHYTDKLTFGLDIKTQNWSKYESFDKNSDLKNSNSLSIGAQYIPNPASGYDFFQHVQYRVGYSFSNTYLNIDNSRVTQQTINFGAGFPIIKSLSTLNIAFQYGTRGTTDNNLLKEKYYGINLGLTFLDSWFVKRKFD